MISDEAFEKIAKAFCGDELQLFAYKTGPKLVAFFNKYFQTQDVYGQGFPTRWFYVSEKIKRIYDMQEFNKFLNIILNLDYILKEFPKLNFDKARAAERIKSILEFLQDVLKQDSCYITYYDKEYHLLSQSDDLQLIGEGGFANVYKQKSTGLAIKKLKEEFLSQKSIVSRFKREYEIMMSLKDVSGIVKAYNFNQSEHSYSMEMAESTLYKSIENNLIDNNSKVEYIRQILTIMSKVHSRNILHRDLSPTNIFIFKDCIKIADFGLGKDLSTGASHQTLMTNNFGQYLYCAPEQMQRLAEASKKSDVFSLGRIINFVMTKDPLNANHAFNIISEKATASQSENRYVDATNMKVKFEKYLAYQQTGEKKNEFLRKSKANIQDASIIEFINALEAKQKAEYLLEYKDMVLNSLLFYMGVNNDNAFRMISDIANKYQEVCNRSFEAYDIFAKFAYNILKADFQYSVKEIAAKMLQYIAFIVNRFYAQDLIEMLKNEGVEPMIEEILVKTYSV